MKWFLSNTENTSTDVFVSLFFSFGCVFKGMYIKPPKYCHLVSYKTLTENMKLLNKINDTQYSHFFLEKHNLILRAMNRSHGENTATHKGEKILLIFTLFTTTLDHCLWHQTINNIKWEDTYQLKTVCLQQ